MCQETIEFSQTDSVSLFQKRNYKVRLTISERVNEMHPRTAVLEIGAGPNLIRKSSLPSTFSNNIRAVKELDLTGASRSNVIFDGVKLIHVRLGDLCFKAWFGVVTRMEVPLLLGTRFMDRFVKIIYLQERKIVPFHSHPVAIVDSLERSEKNPALTVEGVANGEREGRHHIVRVAKGIQIYPR